MDIIQKAESHVFHLFKDKLSPDYIYHNFNHTLRVVNNASVIAKEEGVEDGDMEMIMLAAWFHDVGYIEGAESHEDRSAVSAAEFLAENGYPAEKSAHVSALIKVTKVGAEPQTLHERIIKDADCSHFADKNYPTLSELLREEWKIT